MSSQINNLYIDYLENFPFKMTKNLFFWYFVPEMSNFDADHKLFLKNFKELSIFKTINKINYHSLKTSKANTFNSTY